MIKACKDCKYYRENPIAEICGHPEFEIEQFDFVSGLSDFVCIGDVYDARMDEKYCGKNARWFAPKDEK